LTNQKEGNADSLFAEQAHFHYGGGGEDQVIPFRESLMRSSWRYVGLCAGFLAISFLTVWLNSRRVASVPPAPLDDWDMPRLAAHFNRAGLPVQMTSTQKNGVVSSSVFFTIAHKDWRYLNDLSKNPERIDEWRGVVYCECTSPASAANLVRQWGDHTLLVGPFIFYGDATLLARISVALKHSVLLESSGEI
jgi:hypothetical protein